MSGDHRTEEIFVLKGPDVRRGVRLAPASALDVAPTLLYILVLPVAREMDGRLIRETFEASFLETHPIEHVDSYDGGERLTSPEPIPSPLDPGIIQNLKDLWILALRPTAQSRGDEKA